MLTRIQRPALQVAAALCAAAALAACGSSSSSGTTAHTTAATTASTTTTTTAAAATSASTGKIAIRNYMFTPMDVTVKQGAKLTFTNYDQTAHTATADNGAFDTGTIKPGKSVTVTFNKAGTFAYKCLFHAFMTAKITVTPS